MDNVTKIKETTKIITSNKDKWNEVFKTENELNRQNFVEDNKGFNVNKPVKLIVSDDKKTVTVRSFFFKRFNRRIALYY